MKIIIVFGCLCAIAVGVVGIVFGVFAVLRLRRITSSR